MEETRYRCALAVTVRRRTQDVEALTTNVGTGGAFVRSEASPPRSSLVRLVFTLPGTTSRLEVSACVADVVEPAAALDTYPGFDARFVGLSGAPKEQWDSLLRGLRRDGLNDRSSTLVLARPSYVDRFQRRGLVALETPLRVANQDELRALVDQQVRKGALFVPTAMAIVVGASINVQLMHPVTGDEFPLEGVVRRREQGSRPGVHVELTPLGPETSAGLDEFLDSVLVVADYDVEILDGAVLRVRDH